MMFQPAFNTVLPTPLGEVVECSESYNQEVLRAKKETQGV